MQKQADMEKEFLEAYDRYADALYRHCFFRIHDREQAKDMVQETFMKAWDYIASGGAIENMRAFLYRVANNMIVDSYRKHRSDSLDALTEQGFDVPDDSRRGALQHAELKEVIATFDKLSEDDRVALTLRFVDGWEPRDIAQQLGVSPNVVSVRINRALKEVRSALHVIEPNI